MRANVYIQKQNEAAWNALPNKSEWLNEKLAGGSGGGVIKRASEMVEEVDSENSALKEIEDRLLPVPGYPNVGYDPVEEERYKIKYIDGKMRIIE